MYTAQTGTSTLTTETGLVKIRSIWGANFTQVLQTAIGFIGLYEVFTYFILGNRNN